MAAYADIAKGLLESIPFWTLNYIDRSINHWADALSKLTASCANKPTTPFYIMDLAASSITETSPLVNHISQIQGWRTPLIQFIQGTLPDTNETGRRKIAFKARNCCMENGQLYRRSLTEPLLKCVGKDEVELAIIEIHTGICGEHLAGKKLALQIIRYGFFGPLCDTIMKNSLKIASHVSFTARLHVGLPLLCKNPNF
ncbi:uncharacterized protein LOC141695549 [Apium graveolens]|uniref:uncharacterized protein LOC141695547 n=1 Tax=Apium graveolens TaxID=4045 RepID=UPI003D7AE915